MSLLSRALGVIALALALSQCGGHYRYPNHRDFRPPRTFELRPSQTGPEVGALAERFYGGAPFDHESFAAELAVLLERYPGNATLHEMAAHLAVVRADMQGAWEHFAAAAADGGTLLTPLYLSRASDAAFTVGQSNAMVALLEQIADGHPEPAVRVDAARRLIGNHLSHGQVDEAAARSATLGYLSRWQVIGAFANDHGQGFRTVYPPEEEIDLEAEVPGVRMPVRWQEVRQLDQFGRVRLDQQIDPSHWSIAYLLTHLRSDREQAVQLRLTTTDGVLVFLNGERVRSQELVDWEGTDNVIIPVRLAEGWNRLLIKCASDSSGVWALGARVTDERGASLAGVEADAAPHEPAAPLEVAAPPELVSTVEQVVEQPFRRMLLTRHEQIRLGYGGDATNTMRELLDQAPDHPLALLYGAMTHSLANEAERAIDLLNEGVAQTEGWGAMFLVERGKFYRDRDRFDLAVADLRDALEVNPEAQRALVELSRVFSAREWQVERQAALERIIARWPDDPWAHRELGDCLRDQHYHDRAREQHLRALRLEPGHLWNLGRLVSLALRRLDYDQAIEYRRRMIELTPTYTTQVVGLADTFRLAGRREEARRHYRLAADRAPYWSVPYQRLGLMALEDGDESAAVEAWSRALERAPNNARLAERFDALQRDTQVIEQPLVPSDEEIEAAIARARGLTIAPSAHTVMLRDDEVTLVQASGSARRIVTQVWLAATQRGRDRLIRHRVHSDAQLQQAYTVSPDGRRQEASSIRGGVVRFRRLEVGSVVVIQYVYYSRSPSYLHNHFVSSWSFQGIDRQLVDGRWVVVLPPGRELATHVQGPVEHERSQLDGMDVHTFTAHNVPPLVVEPSMPNVRDLLAMVHASTLTDWGDFIEWERALYSGVLNTGPTLRQLALRLTQGATTRREQLDRLYHFVTEEIRYHRDYEDSIAGVRPHAGPVVLERGYGDCKDKSLLLYLLAQVMGIQLHAALVLTTDNGALVRAAPSQQFNHAIIHVPPQEGIPESFFLDPTASGLDMGTLRADVQGSLALVWDIESGVHRFIPVLYQSAEHQLFRCEIEVEPLGQDQARGQVACTLRGTAAAMLRRAMQNEEQSQMALEQMASAVFSGATLTDGSAQNVNDTWHPLRLEMTMDLSGVVRHDGDHLQLPLPSLGSGLFEHTRLETRDTPLRFGPPETVAVSVRYRLPDGAAGFVRLPEPFEERHDCLRVNREYYGLDDSAAVALTFVRTCAELPAADYPAYRRIGQRVNNAQRATIVYDLL